MFVFNYEEWVNVEPNYLKLGLEHAINFVLVPIKKTFYKLDQKVTNFVSAIVCSPNFRNHRTVLVLLHVRFTCIYFKATMESVF